MQGTGLGPSMEFYSLIAGTNAHAYICIHVYIHTCVFMMAYMITYMRVFCIQMCIFHSKYLDASFLSTFGINFYILGEIQRKDLCMFICEDSLDAAASTMDLGVGGLYVCMYLCMYVCMYVCIQ